MLAWLGLGILLAYPIGANLFLRFGFHLLFESTNQVNATFASAWTVWPGTIHVRDLRVVFQDHNVQFAIDLPRGVLNAKLTELPSRTFRATRVRGEGLRFTMRHRIPPESTGAPWVKALPRIPEFRDPPVFESRVPEPPISDDEYNLWTIHLEDVEVGATEIWTQFVRYRGRAVARGAFRLKPARHLWVGPATLELERGKLTLGSDRALADSVSGRIQCVVHPFDVRIPVGTEVFRYISAKLDLTAQGVHAEPVPLLVSGVGDQAVRSAPGHLRIAASVERGRFSERSQLEYTTSNLELESPRWLSRLREVRLGLRGVPAGRGELYSEVATASVHLREAQTPPLTATALTGHLVSSSRDTASSWSVVEGALDIGALEAADLGFFSAALPRGSPSLSGEAELTGGARYRDGALDAKATVRLKSAGVGQGSLRAGLDGELEVELSRARLSDRSGELVARLRGGATLNTSAQRFRMRGTTLDARITASKARASGTLEGSLGSFTGGTQDLSIQTTGRIRAELAKMDLERFAGNGKLELWLENLEVGQKKTHARARRLEALATWQRTSHGLWNAVSSATFEGLKGDWEDTSWRGKSKIDARLIDFDSSGGSGTAELDVVVEDFQSVDRDEPAACPYSRIGRAEVSGKLHLGEPTRGTLQARVDAAQLTWDDFRATFGGELSARVSASRSPERAHVSFGARTFDVRLRSGTSPVHGWEANVPALDLEGYMQSGQKLSGALKVRADQARGRIGRTSLATALESKLRVSAFSPDRAEGRFEGDVQLTNTSVSTGERRVDDWWARIQLGSALLRAGDNLDLSALFRADLRDATPGLVALSAEDALPDWLVTVLPLRELKVEGSVNRRCRLTDITFVSAEGGPLVANGRVQSEPEGASGALLVRLSDLELISAGIAFDPKGTDVTLLAGDNWLGERAREFDSSARQVVERPCPEIPDECSPEPHESD